MGVQVSTRSKPAISPAWEALADTRRQLPLLATEQGSHEPSTSSTNADSWQPSPSSGSTGTRPVRAGFSSRVLSLETSNVSSRSSITMVCST